MLKKNSLFSITLFLLLFAGLNIYSQQNKKTVPQGSIFSNNITDTDNLMAIERVTEVLKTARADARFDDSTRGLIEAIGENKENMDLILASLEKSNPNVRNLQMYKNMLSELKLNLEEQNKMVDANNERLAKVQKSIINIKKDTVFMALLGDTLLRQHFSSELKNLKKRYQRTDSVIKKNRNIMTAQKRLLLNADLTVADAQRSLRKKLKKSGINLMGNEYPNLWNVGTTVNKKEVSSNIKNKWLAEKNVVSYYFKYNSSSLALLILMLSILGWFLRNNIKSLKALDKFHNLEQLDFKYLNSSIWLSLMIIGLNIAIVTNLNAPALYVEFLQLILLSLLSLLFKKHWPKIALNNWYYLVILYILLCFLDLFVEISFLERCTFIAINILAIRYGLVQLKSIKDQLYIKGFFKWASVIFISLNAISLLANIFGRVTISHTLSTAAIIALTQIIALCVLLKIVLEIIILQIYTKRVKQGIQKLFNPESLSNTLKMPFVILISYMWFIVITSNLNIWESISKATGRLLHNPITIGSFTFTLAGIFLFFVIVWIAHLLQNYVAYFFGELDHDDVDDEAEKINKQQHSKLLITRLIVLIVGYLLAVAASGMPMDKLSIVIGALGVGIGLGLQNIVTNFVSGIILIFDRPIQVGDIIEVSSQSGRIKSMGLRTTKINAANGAEIIIPNGNILSQNITNWTYTDNLKLVEINFSVSGDTDPEKINEIIFKTLQNLPLVEADRTPQIYYNSLSDDNFKILVKFWCNIYRTEEVLSNSRQALFRNFKDNKITFTT
jgi:potassium-dependent mechanosensitive channel